MILPVILTVIQGIFSINCTRIKISKFFQRLSGNAHIFVVYNRIEPLLSIVLDEVKSNKKVFFKIKIKHKFMFYYVRSLICNPR